MSLDLSQFHQTFFDESFEGLDAMEAGLLGLDPDQGVADPEVVNAIFRAAHSIKGGAGTFGFLEVGGFTHLLETLLDELRSGQRAWSAEIIEALLQSVDCTRAMLQAATAGKTQKADPALEKRLQELLAAGAPGAKPATQSPKPAAPTGWTLHFVPDIDIAQQGNDPLRILYALQELGEVEVQADISRLPTLAEHDPETCPLSWTVVLRGKASEADVRDVFAWVEDACQLEISALALAPKTASAPAATSAPTAMSDPPTASSGGGQSPPKSGGGEATPAKGGKTGGASRESASSIRVSVEKIDMLINLVGELVITQAMLQQRVERLDPVEHEGLLAGIGQLERNTRHLQEAVMSTRMLPVDFVFSRFPRLVRDTAAQLGKSVQLVTEGEGAELDKGVIEKIVDPLNHIVRNAIDHGVEKPDKRRAAGKPERATIRLSAWHQGGHIMIEVADDGRGLDREKILAKARANGMTLPDTISDSDVWNLVFAPGLSTAEAVTDLSGRGVGMDVVKKNIQALGGQVEIHSATGAGTRVTIRLPLTLAILEGMTVRVAEETMVIPMGSVVESLQVQGAELRSVGGNRSLLKVRDEFVPVLRLDQVFNYGYQDDDPTLVVLVESDREKFALAIDELIGQQQVVVKNLESHYRPVAGISGATILGDGRVALIIDVGTLQEAAAMASTAQRAA